MLKSVVNVIGQVIVVISISIIPIAFFTYTVRSLFADPFLCGVICGVFTTNMSRVLYENLFPEE